MRNFFLLGMAVGCVAAIQGNAEELNSTICLGPNALEVQHAGRPVFQYLYTNVPFKPCAAEFLTPAGVNVLRNAPEDHLHHHALMFAISTDKTDFWAETPDCGKQIHQEFSNAYVQERKGWAVTGFTERLQWIGPESGEPEVDEERTIEVVFAVDLGASLLTWTSCLSVPGNQQEAKLTGHHYHGLGIRFLKSMDTGGRHFNAAGAEGELVRGDERLTGAAWSAYTAGADGKPVTVAMFDAPRNPRPVLWFTMQTPFAYLSATTNTWHDTMVLKAGEPVCFRYGVAVWDGEQDAASVDALYKRWLQFLQED